MELRGRIEKTDEALQDFAAVVELIYPGDSPT